MIIINFENLDENETSPWRPVERFLDDLFGHCGSYVEDLMFLNKLGVRVFELVNDPLLHKQDLAIIEITPRAASDNIYRLFGRIGIVFPNEHKETLFRRS